jgi:hypothetical protein
MVKRAALAAVLAMAPAAAAEPGGRCTGDTCDVDHGPRPWILRDGCTDVSDVVGYRTCDEFGSWSEPTRGQQILVAVGARLRHVVIPPFGVAARSATPTSDTGDDLVTTAIRVAGAEHGFYLGLELELGDVLHHTYPYGAFVQGDAVAGGNLTLGAFDAGAELAVAGRNVERIVDFEHLPEATYRAFVLEARAHADAWLTPWLTVGIELGAGLLERSEWLAGVTAGFHSRAFGDEH